MPGSSSTATGSSASPPRRTELLLLALPLLACHAALLATWDLGAAPVRSVSLLLLAFAAHLVLLPRLDAARDVAALLAVAALLRLLLLPLPPTLSDDIVRYLWDGKVAAAGLDPYRLAPEDPELAPLRDDAWRGMPHKHVATVYPPLALGAFTAASMLPTPRLGLKSILAAADWIACLLLIRLAVRLGHAPGRAAAYAWSPLPCLEIAGMGHVDALVVVFSVATVSLLARRPAAAGIAAAGAVASKLVPLLFLPLWALLAGRQSRGHTRSLDRTRRSALRHGLVFTLTAGACTAALLAPMVVSFDGPSDGPRLGPPPGLVTFGVSWEWNGPLYEPLWRMLDEIDATAAVKRQIDRAKERSDRDDLLNRLYPFVYPQLLAKLVLAAGFALAVTVLLASSLRRRDRPDDPDGLATTVVWTGRLATLVLLAMATVYPWYLLWVLPWAALARHRAWMAASGASVIAYLPQHVDGLELFPWIWLATWGTFFALLPWSRWMPRKAAS